MKETVDISINGIAFKAEYDAYEILKDYFDRLRNACSVEGDEGREIADDIEARASELILSRQKSMDMPVDSKCARWVIEQLGGIDQIPLSDDRTNNRHEAPVDNDKIGYIPKRFYRSKEGARMGGIFSGLGTYFDIDPSILRLSFAVIMLAMLFFSRYSGFFSGIFFFSILTYISAWILVPMAVTPRQKLELEGQPVTPATVRQSFRSGNRDARTDGAATVMTRSIYILSKLIMFAVYAAVIMVSVILAIGIIGVLAGGYGVMAFFHDTLSVFVDTPVYLLGTIAILSAVATLGLLLYLLVCILTGKPMRPYVAVPLIAIWVVCWILSGIFGFKEIKRYSHWSDLNTTFTLDQPSGDTLYVFSVVDPDISYEYWDGEGVPVFTRVRGYAQDRDDYHLTVKRSSCGHSRIEASKLAEQIDFGIYQRGDTVFVDYGQFYTLPGSYRNQKVTVAIDIPDGKQVMIDRNLRTGNRYYGAATDGMYPLIRYKNNNGTETASLPDDGYGSPYDTTFAENRETREIISIAE